MTDPQIPFDRVEKKREDARESGFANKMQEKTIDRQHKELNEESKLNLRPDEQEDMVEKIRESTFAPASTFAKASVDKSADKERMKTQKKWWQFWRS